MTNYILVFISVFGLAQASFGQELSRKGHFNVYWGWNRSQYTKSDIHFSGDNYDFTLNDVLAHDRQTKFGLNPYFHPGYVSLPQTNAHIGYFIDDHYELALSLEHMKYVMDQYQRVEIDGEIWGNSVFAGVYEQEEIQLIRNFMKYEHTDGLNYINLELNRQDLLADIQVGLKHPFKLYSTLGLAGGFMLPRTNATVLGGKRYDDFHVSGYGISSKIGLQVHYKNIFFQTDIKGGFIDMNDIRINENKNAKAKQHFGFVQYMIAFGYEFSIKSKAKTQSNEQ
ncbi:MAG: hypothetical protein ACPG4W_06110 [Flavobacteriales bacterium]